MATASVHALIASVALALPAVTGELQEIVVGTGLWSGFALASDGDWLATGPADGVNLYLRREGAWVLTDHLDDPASDEYSNFGASLALDREWLAVSAFQSDVDGSQQAGLVYVYRLIEGQWIRVQRLMSPQVQSVEWFGKSLELRDGLLFIGNDPWIFSGAPLVRAYSLSGGQWQLTQVISVGLGGSATGIAISFDSPWLLLGEPIVGPSTPLGYAGRARFFELTANGFEQRQVLLGRKNNFLGYSVALDGDTAMVGSPGVHSGTPGHDCVHVFRRSRNDRWEHEQLLTPDVVGRNGSTDGFGIAMDLRGDRAVIGAGWFDIEGEDGSGAAFAFVRSAGVWDLVDHLRPSDQAKHDYFGASAILTDYSALVSAPWHDHGGEIGSVYAFDF